MKFDIHPYSLTEIVHMMNKLDIVYEMDNDQHLDDIFGVVG